MPDSVTATDDYARRFAGDVGAYLLDVQAKSVFNMLEAAPAIPAPTNILDHAGTHGQLAPLLADQGYRRFVSASSSDLIDRAMDGSEKIVGPLMSLPRADQCFDAVVSVRYLAHAEDVEEAVREMCRVARCSVIVDYPSLRSINIFSRWLFKLKKRIEGNTREYRSILDEQLVYLFKKNGFKLVSTQRQFFIPMALHRAVGSSPVLRAIERIARDVGLTSIMGNPVVARFDRISNR